MNKTVELLSKGFQSSSGRTPEFDLFFRTFKREFTSELKSIGATDIVFSKGHFYISGFFTHEDQAYYFSMPDVRDFGEYYDENSCMNQLLYRTAKNYTDYSGGGNRYVKIALNMADEMCWYFKAVG